MYEYLNSLIDTLSLDHKRGAAEIVADVANLLGDIAKSALKDPENADQLFRRAIKRLAKGQPSMAPILNLLNKACLIREEADDDWGVTLRGFEKVVEDLDLRLNKMQELAEKLPRVDGTLMIFSNSSTVYRMVKACRELGWPERVILSEARPINEGLVMGRKLTQLGVPVTVYSDAALMSNIELAEAVWIGGDAVSAEGLVNKVGSRALGILAKVYRIPFLSLTSTFKVLSDDMLPYFKLLPQNPREIAADDAEDLHVVNEYYETIPLDLITYFFTDEGLQRPKDFLKKTPFDTVSPLFTELATS